MSNSNNTIKRKKDLTDHSQEAFPIILLFSFIIIASFISDLYISNSLLSLPLLITTFISTIITGWGIPKLRALKFSQIIREEGPKKHNIKAGTPTMGGLLIIPIGLFVSNLICINNTNDSKLIVLSALILSFMLIGFFDDWRSLRLNTNSGLSPKAKVALQACTGIIFLSFAFSQEWINSKIYLVSQMSIDLGILIWPLTLFVLLAESNSTNLTDGLDGLASGCGALVFTGLAIQLMLRGGNQRDAAIASFSMAMAGAWLGFLLHNKNPAKVFMGDTGSLAMGAALSGVALLSNSLWALFLMGGVFFAESLSVIIQVWVFKISKQINGKGSRVFRMAPIHHHYELGGHKEQLIVRNFWLITLGLVLLGLLLRSTP